MGLRESLGLNFKKKRKVQRSVTVCKISPLVTVTVTGCGPEKLSSKFGADHQKEAVDLYMDSALLCVGS
jgi:hypothetical protein